MVLAFSTTTPRPSAAGESSLWHLARSGECLHIIERSILWKITVHYFHTFDDFPEHFIRFDLTKGKTFILTANYGQF